MQRNRGTVRIKVTDTKMNGDLAKMSGIFAAFRRNVLNVPRS
jgi:hypothetical protein